MKFLKISAVSTMLLSIGSTYAFDAQAKTKDDNSNGNDAPSFVIGDGSSFQRWFHR